jgi:hypothetical protein
VHTCITWLIEIDDISTADHPPHRGIPWISNLSIKGEKSSLLSIHGAGLPSTFTTKQARAAGVHAARDNGELVELSRGVFRRADAPGRRTRTCWESRSGLRGPWRHHQDRQGELLTPNASAGAAATRVASTSHNGPLSRQLKRRRPLIYGRAVNPRRLGMRGAFDIWVYRSQAVTASDLGLDGLPTIGPSAARLVLCRFRAGAQRLEARTVLTSEHEGRVAANHGALSRANGSQSLS